MTPREDDDSDRTSGADVVRFWEAARGRAGLGGLDVITGSSSAAAVPPPAWAFGRTPQEADDLLALVLAGRKTATASAHWLYRHQGEHLPRPGDLSILLDGRGRPRALVRTTAVEVVPFDEVGAEHAACEGEGDGTLASWRQVHEDLFRAELEAAGGRFRPDMAVVLERLELLHPHHREVAVDEPALV